MSTARDYSAEWTSMGLRGWENIYPLLHRSLINVLLRGRIGGGTRAIELGCGDGACSVELARRFNQLIIIENSKNFLDVTKLRLRTMGLDHGNNIIYCQCTAEEYDPAEFDAGELADVVVAFHILEHLEAPVAVLRKYVHYLNPSGGEFAIIVPNAMSLHRQLGVAMGLVPSEHYLNAQDEFLGHKRVYDPESLCGDLRAAGLTHGPLVGNFIKPLAARAMNNWSPDVLEGLEKLGKKLPHLAADLGINAWPGYRNVTDIDLARAVQTASSCGGVLPSRVQRMLSNREIGLDPVESYAGGLTALSPMGGGFMHEPITTLEQLRETPAFVGKPYWNRFFLHLAADLALAHQADDEGSC